MTDKAQKRKKRLMDLAIKGGTDKELIILDAIDELEDRFEDKFEKIDAMSESHMKLAEKMTKNILKDINSYVPSDEDIKAIAGKAVDLIDTDSLRGKDGDDYVLSNEDKAQIAMSIPVPVVEKVIEKTIVREPVAEVVEVQVLDEKALEDCLPKFGMATRDGLELLKEDERLDRKAIKGLEKMVDQENLDRAVSILDQRTSFLINKVSNIAANGSGGGGSALTVQEIDGSPIATSVNTIKFTNGSVVNDGGGVVTVTTGVGGGGDVSSNTATSVDSEVVLFSGTGGKTVKRATDSGIATLTSGVLSATATTGSGSVVLATSPTLVTPALGTPSALVATNATGTAAGLTAGNVTTNANLTGHVTSVGNAAVLGSFTKAQLSTAVSDGDVLYVGDVTTNATHTGEVTGSGALTVDKTAITGKTLVTAAAGDHVLVADASDSDNLKKVTVQTIVDLASGSGYTNLTQFVAQTAWRVFYSDGSGVITELALGADGTFLKSNGAAAAPTFATPSGSGDVSKVGTPVNNQIGVWTGDGTIEGDANLTWDGTSLNIATAKNFQIAGGTVLADAAGTLTLSGIDAIDATTEATIEGAIDTLANLSSVAGTSGTVAFNAANITDLGDVTFKTGAAGGTIRTGTSNADKFVLQAYDVNGAAYQKVLEADAGNTPTLEVFADSFGIWDTADETKKFAFLLSGGTTGVTMTLASSPTANRTVTFPDATGTLALTSATSLTSLGTVSTALTGVLRADSGVLSADTDVTDLVTAASATAQGKVELATDAEAITGTDTARATTPANITARLAAPGTIGGTTPAAATFTTLTATTVNAFTTGGNITLAENTSIALDPAGSADGKYSGITVAGTGGATIAFGDLVTLDKDDSRWELVDISVAAAATGDARGILGMAVTSSTDGGALTVLLQGMVRADANFPALTIGAPVYASTTGDVVVTQPTTTDHVIRIVGYGMTADELYFNPGNSWITHT